MTIPGYQTNLYLFQTQSPLRRMNTDIVLDFSSFWTINTIPELFNTEVPLITGQFGIVNNPQGAPGHGTEILTKLMEYFLT